MMRWYHDENLVALHWKDNKVVTLLTTIDNASDYMEVNRKVKKMINWKQSKSNNRWESKITTNI